MESYLLLIMLFFSSSSSFYVRKTAIYTITTRNLQYIYKKNIGNKFLSTSKTTAKVIKSHNNDNNYRNVLVPVANGTEEIEAVTIIDTLVRSGASVTIASIHNNNDDDNNSDRKVVICSRGVRIQANKFISDCIDIDWDLIVCPGGMPGAENLRDSVELKELLLRQEKDNKLIGAICAAPAVVLASHKLLDNKIATCYPATKFISMIEKGSKYSMEKVVVDGNIVTSQGPGTSLLFSLKLVELLYDTDTSTKLANEMIL